MKLILICFFTALSQIVVGQITDTLYYPLKIDDLSQNVVIAVKNDTIPCLMLMSDTSLQYYNNFDCMNCALSGYNSLAYWSKGYEVRNIQYQRVDISVDPNYQMPDGSWTLLGRVPNFQWMPIYSFSTYLDINKKELSKNIVVWMAK
jgi:hypothetical protein